MSTASPQYGLYSSGQLGGLFTPDFISDSLRVISAGTGNVSPASGVWVGPGQFWHLGVGAMVKCPNIQFVNFPGGTANAWWYVYVQANGVAIPSLNPPTLPLSSFTGNLVPIGPVPGANFTDSGGNRYIGAFRTGNNGNIPIPFLRYGNKIMWCDSPAVAHNMNPFVTGLNSTSFALVSCTTGSQNICPPQALSAIVLYNAFGVNGAAMLSGNISMSGNSNLLTVFVAPSGTTLEVVAPEFEIPLNGLGGFYYNLSGIPNTVTIAMAGVGYVDVL